MSRADRNGSSSPASLSPSPDVVAAIRGLVPWVTVSAVTWLALYAVEMLALLVTLTTLAKRAHPGASALSVMIGFFLLFVTVAIASVVMLLRAALFIHRLGPKPSNKQAEEALQRLARYWTLSGTFWIVAGIGSILAVLSAFAVGLGAMLSGTMG